MGIRYELSGKRFGFLEVLEKAIGNYGGQWMWKCRCVCGKEVILPSRELRKGRTKSCGCKRAELTAKANTTHGFAGHKNKADEYRIWGEMIQRCTNPKSNRWYTHGARGIKVCERWRSFENFIADMGWRPRKGLCLERRDNDGDYEPSNCYWATKKEQARNKRNTVWLTVDGEKKSVAEWAEITGVGYTTIKERLRRGWSPKEAIGR